MTTPNPAPADTEQLDLALAALDAGPQDEEEQVDRARAKLDEVQRMTWAIIRRIEAG